MRNFLTFNIYSYINMHLLFPNAQHSEALGVVKYLNFLKCNSVECKYKMTKKCICSCPLFVFGMRIVHLWPSDTFDVPWIKILHSRINKSVQIFFLFPTNIFADTRDWSRPRYRARRPGTSWSTRSCTPGPESTGRCQASSPPATTTRGGTFASTATRNAVLYTCITQKMS